LILSIRGVQQGHQNRFVTELLSQYIHFRQRSRCRVAEGLDQRIHFQVSSWGGLLLRGWVSTPILTVHAIVVEGLGPHTHFAFVAVTIRLHIAIADG